MWIKIKGKLINLNHVLKVEFEPGDTSTIQITYPNGESNHLEFSSEKDSDEAMTTIEHLVSPLLI